LPWFIHPVIAQRGYVVPSYNSPSVDHDLVTRNTVSLEDLQRRVHELEVWRASESVLDNNVAQTLTQIITGFSAFKLMIGAIAGFIGIALGFLQWIYSRHQK
jgi:hypothetical protein